jgi:hypothetical protein
MPGTQEPPGACKQTLQQANSAQPLGGGGLAWQPAMLPGSRCAGLMRQALAPHSTPLTPLDVTGTQQVK